MIEDANTLESGIRLETDLCIVGAGAAGITLALQFEHRRERVLLLESGGLRPERATQALYEGAIAAGSPHPPLARYRRRVFGGSTQIWGGRCVPFDPIDFETRPWAPGSAWPFSYADILPFYENAAELCETGEFAFSAPAAFPAGMQNPLFPSGLDHFSETSIERFSCPTNFAARYGRRLKAARNITVLLHANATEICTTADGSAVAALSVKTLAHRHLVVHAKNTVLAAGGLEVPRLLLVSRDRHPHGIGNANDQVGRNYMTHIAGTIGEITLPAGAPRPIFYQRAADGAYCRRRFALTETAQRELQVGNFIARLHHPRLHDPAHRTGALSAVFLAKPFIGFEYASRLHGQTRLSIAARVAHARNILGDLPGVAAFAAHWLRHRTLAARKFPSLAVHPRHGRYSLDFHAEQAPNPESRITLTDAYDALGLPKIHLDWRPSEADFRTVGISLAALASDFAKSRCASLHYDPADVAISVVRDGAYGGHHIGTARISLSPRDGVVDANCRVHGMKNLFIAGSAVFPSSSQANPTLTIVAMTLRLAERLMQKEKEEVLF